MGFKFIFPRECPKCKTEMIAKEIDNLGVLCGRQGVEYSCPDCGYEEFDGIQA